MIPYAPDRQLYVPSTRAQDIILRQGEAAADSAARSGQIWGNALQDLGGIASGYVHDRAARKQEQAQQQALSKRDAAFMSLLDQSGGMPDPKEVYRIFGREKAPKVMEGLLSYHQMTQKQGEEAASHIPGLVRGADAMGEGARKQLYPSLVAAAVKSGAVPDGFLPPDYTEEGWKAIKATVLPPEAPQGPIKLNRNERLIENGKEIIPAMPETPKPEDQIFVVRGGKVIPIAKGSAQPGDTPYERPPAESKAREWVMRDDGTGKLVPVNVPVTDIRPGDQPADTRQQGRPVTSGDAGRLTELDTGIKQAETLKNVMTTGTTSWLGTKVPDFVTNITGWGTDSKSQLGVIKLVKQIIGKGLEGGVLRKEDEAKYAEILPQIGDAPEVAKNKINNLISTLNQKHEVTLNSLEDANYDVSRFRKRMEEAGSYPAKPSKKNPFR